MVHIGTFFSKNNEESSVSISLKISSNIFYFKKINYDRHFFIYRRVLKLKNPTDVNND